MKSIIVISAFLLSITASAQCNANGKLTGLISGGNHNFKMVGDESNVLIDSLFANLPKTKRKGYTWKFKNVQIPGVSEPVTFDVRQGVHGLSKSNSQSSCCGSTSYFHTYTSEKYRQERLKIRTESEKDAVIIYVKKGKRFGLEDKKEIELVKEYLLAFYN